LSKLPASILWVGFSSSRPLPFPWVRFRNIAMPVSNVFKHLILAFLIQWFKSEQNLALVCKLLPMHFAFLGLCSKLHLSSWYEKASKQRPLIIVSPSFA
jgi:hypothetical protein